MLVERPVAKMEFPQYEAFDGSQGRGGGDFCMCIYIYVCVCVGGILCSIAVDV